MKKKGRKSTLRIKRIVALILVGITIITSSSIHNIYADDEEAFDGSATDDDGSGGYTSSLSNGSWASEQQGIRIYAVDQNFTLVSTVLDITFGGVASNGTEKSIWEYGVKPDHVYSATANQDINTNNTIQIHTWDEIVAGYPELSNNRPDAPLIENPDKSDTNHVLLSTGDQFAEWVEKGIGGHSFQYIIANLAKVTSNTRKSTVTIGSLLPKTGGKSGQTTNSKSAMYSSQTTVDGIIQSAGGINNFFSDVYAQEAARQIVKDTGVREGQI